MAAKAGNIEVKKTGEDAPARRRASGIGYAPGSALRGELDRVFNRFFPEGWPTMGDLMDMEPLRGLAGRDAGGILQGASVDISETQSEYEITAELPGIDEKDVELDVSDGVLTLKAEKREEREEEKKDYHLTERRFGSIRRSFRIPDGVEVDRIKADFKKGVLRVRLPKSKEAKSKQRRIPVKSS